MNDLNTAYALFYVAMSIMALAIAIVVAADRYGRHKEHGQKH